MNVRCFESTPFDSIFNITLSCMWVVSWDHIYFSWRDKKTIIIINRAELEQDFQCQSKLRLRNVYCSLIDSQYIASNCWYLVVLSIYKAVPVGSWWPWASTQYMRYWLALVQCRAVLFGTWCSWDSVGLHCKGYCWWYWVRTGLLCLYILKKWRSGQWLPISHKLTHRLWKIELLREEGK